MSIQPLKQQTPNLDAHPANIIKDDNIVRARVKEKTRMFKRFTKPHAHPSVPARKP